MNHSAADPDFGEIVSKRRSRLRGPLLLILFLALLVPSMVFNALAVGSGTPSDLRERSVTLTILSTLAGPFLGGIARDGQSCCVEVGWRLFAYCGPVLAIGLLAQVVLLPDNLACRIARPVLWGIGWAAWLLGGPASLMHAFS